MTEELDEEFEVLESIYPTEFSRTSDREINIDVEPDDPIEGDPPLLVTLNVNYPEDYPNVLPELSLLPVQGELETAEEEDLIKELNSMGIENLGLAMTFSLVSHLRECLSTLVKTRSEITAKREQEKERLAIEAEEAKTRGTPVTVESFKEWKQKFDAEIAAAKAQEDDEKLKGMTPKERDEWKRRLTRISGRQLFERNRNLEDESLVEEEGESVDFSQYERVRQFEEDEERVAFEPDPESD